MDRQELHSMMRLLGFRLEARLRCYGKDGADYYQFAYLSAPADAGGETAAEPAAAAAMVPAA